VTGWQEWDCAISGASVDDRCGIGLDECIPLLAWRWVRGEVTWKRITRGLGLRDKTKEAIIAMAQWILEREGTPLDLKQMSEAELGDLAGQIKAALKAKAAARKLLPGLKRRLAALHRDRERLDAEIETLAVAVAEIETGKPVRFVRDAAAAAPEPAVGDGDRVPRWKQLRQEKRLVRDEKRLADARTQDYTGDLAGLRGWNISRALRGKKKSARKAGLSADAKALASALPGTVPSQLRRE
jgi:hypothetical protein